MINIGFEKVELNGGFWKDKYELNAETTIYAVKERFLDSGRFDALLFKYRKGMPEPHIFYDSDVAKWIEAVAYLLQKNREKYADLEEFCDKLIESMDKHRRGDGYLNSYFQQIAPDKAFTDRNAHELYCAGHLMEAALAYRDATGKDKFFKIMDEYCDLIIKVFEEEKSAAFVTPGHEEIELALIRLYEKTQNVKYLRLCNFFLDSRGNNDKDSLHLEKNRNMMFDQSHMPIRDMQEAVGHAVRAVYLYSAMADAARINGDDKMRAACFTIFKDIRKKMYVTGGIGASRYGEAFSAAYDLPNLTAYSETCAAIGLIFFCQRMFLLEADSAFTDTIERVLYNGFLSSVDLKGTAFFYENPLEICRKEKDKDTRFLVPEARPRLPIWKRKELFDCSCCPPNINRVLASVGGLIYSEDEKCVYLHQYISNSVDCGGGRLTVFSDFPNTGKVTVQAQGYSKEKFAFRLPEWCKSYKVTLGGKEIENETKKGYIYLTVDKNFNLELEFDMPPRFVRSHPSVRDNAGKVCLMKGPVVYCLEEVDNGAELYRISVGSSTEFRQERDKSSGMAAILCEGWRDECKSQELYPEDIERKKIALRFVPYCSFANRSESDMLVWIRKEEVR